MSTELTVQEAALAWAQGKRVLAAPPGTEDWRKMAAISEIAEGEQVFNASVFYRGFRFRLAPEPPAKKWRPWKPEEVPIGAQTKTKVCDSEIQMIVGRNLLGVLLAQDNGAYPFRDMLELRLHSLDGGKTWLPCGVEVSE